MEWEDKDNAEIIGRALAVSVFDINLLLSSYHTLYIYINVIAVHTSIYIFYVYILLFFSSG